MRNAELSLCAPKGSPFIGESWRRSRLRGSASRQPLRPRWREATSPMKGRLYASRRLPFVGERFECQPSGLSGEAGNEMSESTETSGNPSGAAAPIEVAESCRRQATEGFRLRGTPSVIHQGGCHLPQRGRLCAPPQAPLCKGSLAIRKSDSPHRTEPLPYTFFITHYELRITHSEFRIPHSEFLIQHPPSTRSSHTPCSTHTAPRSTLGMLWEAQDRAGSRRPPPGKRARSCSSTAATNRSPKGAA